MTQRTFIDKNGNSWEWEETPEVTEALKNLHGSSTLSDVSKLELKAPDYGVGK